MLKFGVIFSLAVALWAIPSAGTRGQGTLGDRFVHADQSLVDESASSQGLLRRADDVAIVAVHRL